MKKLIVLLILILVGVGASAQDVIVRKDGSTILCRVLEVNASDVVYKKWSDINGANYIIDRSLISNINYQDGRQDKLGEQAVNAYAPGLQQTGDAQYNDNALIAIDKTLNENPALKRAKKLTIFGSVTGGVLIAGGVGLMCLGVHWTISDDGMLPFVCGTILTAGGIATTTGCLIKAHQLRKKATEMSVAPVLQHNFNFANGASLALGVDILHDNHIKQNTFGLGLRFNF